MLFTDEIWNDLNVVKIERFDRRLLQKFRYRRHTVRLLQAVTRDRQIAAIGADERNVGAVKRRDDRHVAFLLDGFASEYRRDRMRYRVMNVQQIELFGAGDRGHFGG